MSDWIEQIENHPIHDELRAVRAALDEIRNSWEDVPADAVERLDRIEYVIGEVERRMQHTDPNLVPTQPLNKIQSVASQINSHLSNFQSDGNSAHIQTAHTQVENALVHLASIPNARTSDDMDAIRESAVALRRSAGQHMRHVEEEGQKALEELTSLKSQLAALSTQVETEIEKVSDLLTNQAERFETAESTRATEFEDAQTTRSTAHSTFLEERETEWTELLESRDTEYQDLYESIETKINSLETQFSKKTDLILEDMKARKADAEKIVGAITDTGMVGGYQRVANSEHRSAVFWRFIAAASLIGLVVFAIVLFKVSLDDNFQVSIPLTVTRVFIAGAVAILAGYAARQADKHDRAQRRYRKMELELASIAPFLHEFPEADALKIKTDLAMKMFAQEELEAAKSDKTDTKSTMKLLETALDSVKALVGKT